MSSLKSCTLTRGKPAVVVPRVKPGLEQFIRAQRMAALGLLRTLHPDRLSGAALLDAVLTELAALALPTTHSQLKALDGLARSTAEIFELIGLRPAARANFGRPAAPEPAARAQHRTETPNPSMSWHKHTMIAAARSAC